MTRLLTILAFCFAALIFSCNPAQAQERRPELTPEQKLTVAWTLANAVTALVVGAPVFLYATAMGKQKELCDVMKGTYDPTKPDICAGGDWVRVIPYIRDLKD